MRHSPQFLNLVAIAQKVVREISCQEVENALSKGTMDFLLIDVREESEWNEGHLPGACHLGKGIIERDIEVQCSDQNKK
ncbi:MAG: rhodanese-like domain-containing protein, partial [Bdellovibrionota bacterium]